MFQELYMRRIAAVIGVMIVVALIAYTYLTLKQAQYMYSGPTSITVRGEGEIFATPDTATFSFGVESKEADATTAQNKASETMEAVISYLKESGVEEKDIKTEYYNLTPRYEYPEVVCTSFYCPPQGEPKLVGYQVSQTVSVKLRDRSKAGDIISGVGNRGATNVSGLSFTIDDPDAYKAQAREEAIKDAKGKAEVLAKTLGARLVRMNGYWEDEGGYPIPYGMGGAMDAVQSKMMPERAAELPVGENTIVSRVSISYEIR
jgi:uncharacterized protein YggE